MDTLNNLGEILSNSVKTFALTISTYLPKLLLAVVLVLCGWLLARLLRHLILRFGDGIDRLLVRLRNYTGQLNIPVYRNMASTIAAFGYWLVILLFVTAAFRALALPGISELLHDLILYLPRLVIALVIVVAGYFLASWARNTVNASGSGRGLQSSRPLSRIVQAVIIAFAFILGVGQLGLDVTLLVNVATILAAAVFGGIAIAFGLGSGIEVGNIIAAYRVNKVYGIGQRVQIGEITGEIVEITSTAVVLDTETGRALVPAKIFNESASILIRQAEDNND
ncbi:hypothetical protein ACFL17_03355 [Pseudomonadota bacterium]